MGNTKHFYFEGSTTKNITKELIYDLSHGSYVSLEIDCQGYLSMHNNYMFVVGCIHSYSMIGKDFCDNLSKHFDTLIIHYLDFECDDFYYFEYDNSILTDQYILNR